MPGIHASPARPPLPPVAPGFEHVKRHWDSGCARWSAKILPGEYFITRSDEAITTVLGSCIAACIRDPVTRIGGMNHFMLPEDGSVGKSAWNDSPDALATRYGAHAMESLIDGLMKLGAGRDRLEVKLFGGARILTSMTDVGRQNIAFAKEFLRHEGLKIAAEDIGDVHARRVLYFPDTGIAMLKKLRAIDVPAIVQSETNYLTSLSGAPIASIQP